MSDFFDGTPWPGPGIYIGKNVFRDYPPHNLSFLKAMKAAGIRVWYHDEEGGLYCGKEPRDWEKELASRVDPSSLGPDDKILTWGDYQADYYRRVGVAADVRVTGTVNFEMYRPEYAASFAEYDAEQTGGAHDYVLYNGRFGAANGYYTGRGHIINDSYFSGFFGAQHRFDLLSSEGLLLYSFVGLLAQLALSNPHLKVYVRPHPGEDPRFYANIFSSIRNIRLADSGDAGSWIRRARCLVQNGCTTAIQAYIAGKPVITYAPPDTDDPATVPLPNEVGTKVHSRTDAIAAILNPPLEQASGRWPLAISRLNTIDIIAELVAETTDSGSVDEERLRRIVRMRAIDRSLRGIAYRVLPSKGAAASMRARFFDHDSFERLPTFVDISNQHWGSNVRVQRLTRYCWRLRSSRMAGVN
jgi:surface carbohydrate biosynthesis protein